MRRRNLIGVFLVIGACAVILGGIPLLFLVYGGWGSVILGLGMIGSVAVIQHVLFRPFWRRLRTERGILSRVKESAK